MSEHKFKIGDSCEFRDKRQLVYCVDFDRVFIVDRHGARDICDPGHSRLYHLPDCDSWDWKPIEPPEGFRLMGNEEVIQSGDRYLNNEGNWIKSVNYGRNVAKSKTDRVLAYARKLEPPKPKFRPFKSAAEYEPFKNEWLARTNENNKVLDGKWRPVAFSDVGIYREFNNVMTYQEGFEKTLFINDQNETRPFGVEE